MKRFARALLWTAALLAPGGLVLLPFLASDVRVRRASPRPTA